MELNQFQVIRPLGRGAYGQVMLAKANKKVGQIESNECVAIKIISKKNSTSIKSEVEVLKQVINKPFLSQIYGSFQYRTDVFLILRYETNGSLYSLLCRHKILKVEFARQLTVDVLLGLQHMYMYKVLHGDLKPENILIDAHFRAHVADFGMARNFTDKPVKERWGTPTYMSPEQLRCNEPLNEEIEIFIMGIIFVEMVTGSHPFLTESAEADDIHANILKLEFRMPNLASHSATSFIRHTLCERKFRLNQETVMRHRFIEPKVEEQVMNYNPPPKLFDTKDYEPFINNINFLKNISGVDIAIGAVHFNEQDVADHINTLNVIRKQLKKIKGAELYKIRVIEGDYYVECAKCNKNLKVKLQIRGIIQSKNYSVQPFVRHFAKH